MKPQHETPTQSTVLTLGWDRLQDKKHLFYSRSKLKINTSIK